MNIPYASIATQLYRPLERFLARLRIPFVATLHDSPSYALADARGLGVCEVGDARAARDWVAWRPLIDWLDSRRSLPRACGRLHRSSVAQATARGPAQSVPDTTIMPRRRCAFLAGPPQWSG